MTFEIVLQKDCGFHLACPFLPPHLITLREASCRVVSCCLNRVLMSLANSQGGPEARYSLVKELAKDSSQSDLEMISAPVNTFKSLVKDPEAEPLS